MNLITKTTTIAAVSGLLLGQSANAAVLALYGDGTDVDAAALPSVAAAIPNLTVSDLSDFGAQTGDPSRVTRSGFGTATPAGTVGSSVGSEWFEARSTENQGPTSSTDNYFVFTATADPGSVLDLTALKYDFWVSPANATVTTADAEAFISVDGGAFTSFGSITATDDDGDGSVAAPLAAANFDLSSITGAQSVEVRIGIGYSQGNSASISGFVQGIQLEGDVNPVPEPSSSALLGLGGLALILRRRK